MVPLVECAARLQLQEMAAEARQLQHDIAGMLEVKQKTGAMGCRVSDHRQL